MRTGSRAQEGVVMGAARHAAYVNHYDGGVIIDVVEVTEAGPRKGERGCGLG